MGAITEREGRLAYRVENGCDNRTRGKKSEDAASGTLKGRQLVRVTLVILF